MDFNEIKNKVLSTLGQATDGAKNIAGATADKAKAGGRIAKLSMEAASARDEIKKTYLEIGRLYYDTHKDDPEGFFVQLFEEVRIAEEEIAAKEAEIAELKERVREGFPEISVEITKDAEVVDFDKVVEATEAEVEAEPFKDPNEVPWVSKERSGLYVKEVTDSFHEPHESDEFSHPANTANLEKEDSGAGEEHAHLWEGAEVAEERPTKPEE